MERQYEVGRSKFTSKFLLSALKAVSLAVTFGGLSVGFAANSYAGVIDASASAFDISVNAAVTVPSVPPLPPVVTNLTVGPLNSTTASGNNVNQSNAIVTANVPPFLTTSSTVTTEAISFIPSGPGNANSSATVNNLSLILAGIGNSLSATTIRSTASLTKDSNQVVTATGTTTIVNSSLVVAGIPVILQVSPPANTVVNAVVLAALGIQVILNEQIFNGSPVGAACVAPCTDVFSTTAIHIIFNNTVFGVSTVSGDILVAHSEASLTKDIQAVAVTEPGTIFLLGLGLIGLFFLARRQESGKIIA